MPRNKNQVLDFVAGKGATALGGRLRRLSELIDAQTALVYREYGVEFEQRWFGVLNQIILLQPVSVSQIAAALKITHVSVSQSVKSLKKAGFVIAETDAADSRRTLLSLSKEGQQFSARLAPVWQVLEDVAAEIDREAGGAVTVLEGLERALERESIKDRVLVKLRGA